MAQKTPDNRMIRRSHEPDWFFALRRAAWRRYRTLPEMKLRYGLGVAFDAAAVEWPFRRRASGSGTAGAAVVSDGQDLALTLAEALRNKRLSARLRRHFEERASDNDPLYAWHEAHCADGLVVHVPGGRRTDKRIKIDYCLEEAVRLDRLIIVAEPGSAVTVVERLLSGTGRGHVPLTRTCSVDVLAGENASVNYLSVQNLDDRSTSFVRKRAWCDRGAVVSWADCNFGGDFVSVSAEADLLGEGSGARIRNLFFGNGSQRFDLRQQVRHVSALSFSDFAARGVLDGRAKTICRGLINIGRGAHGCQGHQKADTLLLNDGAEAAFLPALEINNDDIECGHAASVGSLDQEKLFYLMSRGLDRTAATRQLIEGFFAPMIGEMKESGLEEMVTCLIGHRFGTAEKMKT